MAVYEFWITEKKKISVESDSIEHAQDLVSGISPYVPPTIISYDSVKVIEAGTGNRGDIDA